MLAGHAIPKPVPCLDPPTSRARLTAAAGAAAAARSGSEGKRRPGGGNTGPNLPLATAAQLDRVGSDERALEEGAQEAGGPFDGLGAGELNLDQHGALLDDGRERVAVGAIAVGVGCEEGVVAVVGRGSEGEISGGGVPLAEGGQHLGLLHCLLPRFVFAARMHVVCGGGSGKWQ